MSAFKKFGIERLSPSSLNCWLGTPGLWTLRYLAGVRDDGSPAMWRGTAVEAGLHRILLGKDLTEARTEALAEFEQRALGDVSDHVDAERNLIPAMVSKAADWHAECLKEGALAPLAATQLKVETRLDGVSVPVIGYLDFTFMEGSDIDCKTTKACPSKPRPEHVRQMALYWQARQRPQSLLYLTDKKFAFLPVPDDELRAGLSDLTRAAQSLERFLSIVPNADIAIRAMPMDRSHYAWSAACDDKLNELQEAF